MRVQSDGRINAWQAKLPSHVCQKIHTLSSSRVTTESVSTHTICIRWSLPACFMCHISNSNWDTRANCYENSSQYGRAVGIPNGRWAQLASLDRWYPTMFIQPHHCFQENTLGVRGFRIQFNALMDKLNRLMGFCSFLTQTLTKAFINDTQWKNWTVILVNWWILKHCSSLN
jgi:hypothetical protein